MTDLTAEQFGQVPEFLKTDYQKVNVDGAEVYRHVGEIKTAKLKGSLDELDKKYKSEVGDLSQRLTKFEQEQAAKIENARKEALEQAKNKGDVAEIEKRYQEQMADLEKRVKESTRAEVVKEFTEKTAAEKAKSIAATIAAEKAVDPYSRETLQELLERRVKVDPETGKEFFLGDDGSALSLDRAGFVREILEKQPRYARLIKSGVVTNSPGNINGSNASGGGAEKTNEAADKAKKSKDLNGFLRAQLTPR